MSKTLANTRWTALAASELYKLRTGIQPLGIPYKGAPQTLPSLKSGEIDFQFVDAGMAVQQIRAGRWRGVKEIKKWGDLLTLAKVEPQ